MDRAYSWLGREQHGVGTPETRWHSYSELGSSVFYIKRMVTLVTVWFRRVWMYIIGAQRRYTDIVAQRMIQLMPLYKYTVWYTHQEVDLS